VRNAYSYGSTTLGTTELKPEKSESVTFGLIAEPVDGLSFTVDFFQIIKKNAITSASNAAAIEAYYAGEPIPAGYNVIPAAADINNPNAQPLIGFVESGYVNANEVQAKGIDYAILYSQAFGPVKFTSAATASQIIELSTTYPDGFKEQYAGTMGNYNLTAGSGTPRWHGDWSNTLDFGKFSATLTANYFGGYNMSAADQGDTPGDCGEAVDWAPCEVPDYLTFDLTGRVNVTDAVSVYANIMNLADKNPPFDPVTYGAYNYNSVQGGLGILGRNYRLGVKVNF
jgi:iron complex outermembrane receptor protein